MIRTQGFEPGYLWMVHHAMQDTNLHIITLSDYHDQGLIRILFI